MGKIVTETLVYPIIETDTGSLRADYVYLGFKGMGFGEGVFNGFGGKLQEGEIDLDCMLRELQEEAGFSSTSHWRVAELEFYIDQDTHHVFVWISNEWRYREETRKKDGEIVSVKMFGVHDLPFSCMWPDDRIWLPHVLDGSYVLGRLWIDTSRVSSFDLMVRGTNHILFDSGIRAGFFSG